MKRYEGIRHERSGEVLVDGVPLNVRFDLRKHSPTGFEWGYHGSGPAQLALALLADCVGDDLAVTLYQEFKRRVVANLPEDHWTLTSEEIEQTVRAILREVEEGVT